MLFTGLSIFSRINGTDTLQRASENEEITKDDLTNMLPSYLHLSNSQCIHGKVILAVWSRYLGILLEMQKHIVYGLSFLVYDATQIANPFENKVVDLHGQLP